MKCFNVVIGNELPPRAGYFDWRRPGSFYRKHYNASN